MFVSLLTLSREMIEDKSEKNITGPMIPDTTLRITLIMGSSNSSITKLFAALGKMRQIRPMPTPSMTAQIMGSFRIDFFFRSNGTLTVMIFLPT